MRIEMQLHPDDPTIAPLREAWRSAGARHRGRHNALAYIACERLADLRSDALPPVVRAPLALIPSVAALLSDPNWQVGDEAREQFAGALAYFVDPNDLIPDDTDGYGYLDDALVLKLALADVHHEWLAWRDYCDYLAAYPEDIGIDRPTWLERRRKRFALTLRKRNAARDYAPSGRRESSFGDAGRYAGAGDVPTRFGVR